MLRAPSLPSLDATVEVVRVLGVYRRDQTVLRPWVAVTAIDAVRDAGGFQVVGAGSADLHEGGGTKQLEGDLLATAPVHRCWWPRVEHDRECVAVASVATTPAVRLLDGRHRCRAWRTWTIPCTVVQAVIGGMYSDPTSSWQAIKDAYPTWAR